MRTRALVFVAALACHGCGKDKERGAAPANAAPPARSAASATPASEPPPGPCKASSERPVELATIAGDVHGFAGDATHLYYASWSIYGGRGDLGMIRKDGGGPANVDSLQLEPRALVLDDSKIYYTSGIRLLASAKMPASDSTTLAEAFSSQDIALHGDSIYGIPGDYGPYDRVAKIAKKGGEVEELVNGTRRSRSEGPNGFSAIAVDDSGIYVTDSSGDRVLRLPLPKGKATTLANAQDRPYALAVTGKDVFFTLARKGNLMAVSKSGGAPKTLAKGLASMTPIAADENVVYATLAGQNEDAPQSVAKISSDTGETAKVAAVPGSEAVCAIAVDERCVYWAQRINASKTVVYGLGRR